MLIVLCKFCHYYKLNKKCTYIHIRWIDCIKKYIYIYERVFTNVRSLFPGPNLVLMILHTLVAGQT
jgi:hypothetical protein